MRCSTCCPSPSPCWATPRPYAWLAAGLLAFLVLDQYLSWHHCRRPVTAHRPVGYLIPFADGLHNLIGGLAIGAALSGHLNVAVLIPFAAAGFIYIALADLVPELTTARAAHAQAIHTLGFTAGLALLQGIALTS